MLEGQSKTGMSGTERGGCQTIELRRLGLSNQIADDSKSDSNIFVSRIGPFQKLTTKSKPGGFSYLIGQISMDFSQIGPIFDKKQPFCDIFLLKCQNLFEV